MQAPSLVRCAAGRFAGLALKELSIEFLRGGVDRIFEEYFADTASPNVLRSKEVFRRLAPKTSIIGPVAEAEGLSTHVEYWPKFLSREDKARVRK